MATPQDFVDACSAASDALSHLSTLADALGASVGGWHFIATDDQDVALANNAKRFATVTGPIGLQRAIDTGKPDELMYLQRGLQGVTKDVSDTLVDDVIERFLLFAISPLLGLAPAEVLDQARDTLADLPVPPAPADIPLPVFLAGGAGVGSLLAFTASGNPRMAIGGAVGGLVLGYLARLAFQKLQATFLIGGGS